MVERITRSEAPSWVRARLAGSAGTSWIGVDGFGAAGKSTLAAAIAGAVGGVVVPVDDFGRVGVRGWDRELFIRQVLEPLMAGRPARYQAWDLVADAALDWREVPVGVPVIVEGVSSTDVRVPVPWDLTIWVEASAEVRWQRILDRDQPELLERWRTDWLPNEEAYAAEQRPWERVDAIVPSPSEDRDDAVSLRSWHSWRRRRTRPTGQRSTPQTKIIKAMWPTTPGSSPIGRTSIAPGRRSPRPSSPT